MTSWLERHEVVCVLDEDADLAADLTAEEVRLACERAVAGVIRVDDRRWDTTELRGAADPGWLGVLVLDGLLLRRVRVGRRSACELFGPGDIVRPWDIDGEYAPLPIGIDWIVLEPMRLAVLDTAFALRVARWPSISSRIVGRVAQRARYLTLTQAVTHLPRVHARLLILFWLLAERWGRVSPHGVYVRLPLTHSVLAMLVGAQRPTVTLALQRLARGGLLLREQTDRWLLTKAATQMLDRPESLQLIEDLAAEAD
jgi:CRP-like cAMP-binding protein